MKGGTGWLHMLTTPAAYTPPHFTQLCFFKVFRKLRKIFSVCWNIRSYQLIVFIFTIWVYFFVLFGRICFLWSCPFLSLKYICHFSFATADTLLVEQKTNNFDLEW